jgi:hypothetical protein
MKTSPTASLPKRELCRRSVRLCILFLRNLAYYRTGQGPQGMHLLDPSEPTVNFWRQANSNFIDMYVLDWCKLFADKQAVHHWRKIVSDPAKFEADLLAHLNLTPDEFQKLIDMIRFYRDKFLAHLDEHNIMDIPTLDLLAKAIWFYHAHVVTNEVQPGYFAGIPTDTPDSSIAATTSASMRRNGSFNDFPAHNIRDLKKLTRCCPNERCC